ncbi:MAG: hypothetical protein ACI9MC_003930 [Kiritimatiellia bacterium]|jgi:hypothetical protein
MRALLLTLLMCGCGMPDADKLYGLWANNQDGDVRVWRFADTLDVSGLTDQTDVFELYHYADGGDALIVQRGTYTVELATLVGAGDQERPALVQNVLWSIDSNEIGATFGNEILRASGAKIVFASNTTNNGKRVFDAVSELP